MQYKVMRHYKLITKSKKVLLNTKKRLEVVNLLILCNR